jgi:nitric oxide reductase subunit B
VVGSLAGQWLSVHQRLGSDLWYWFGHQGYEDVDLGRFWQIFLFIGLFLWLFLMTRALWPASGLPPSPAGSREPGAGSWEPGAKRPV